MGLLDSVKSELVAEWEDFEALMASTLRSDCGLLEKINKYLLDNSGKKLRPLLALAAASAAGRCTEAAVTCAAVSELMHTATLLHDDVVDESDLRRGAPTVRSLFSTGTSVLMGDYWLSKAVNLLVGLGNLRIMRLFSVTIEDLASGELLQMEKASSLDTSEQDYMEIIRCKTASLFVSSVESAAIASGASEESVSALGRYALKLGLLFQIRDDILDYDSSVKTGKDADCDISERKITLPLLCAFEAVAGSRERITARMSEIDVSDPSSEANRRIVREVKDFVMNNGGIEAARKKMRLLADEAAAALDVLPEGGYRSFLYNVTEALVGN